jgi:hypothetical protein
LRWWGGGERDFVFDGGPVGEYAGGDEWEWGADDVRGLSAVWGASYDGESGEFAGGGGVLWDGGDGGAAVHRQRTRCGNWPRLLWGSVLFRGTGEI